MLITFLLFLIEGSNAKEITTNAMSMKRGLSSCSSILNWGECNTDPDWAYLNDECTSDPGISIYRASHDQSTQTNHWGNSVNKGFIQLEDQDSSTLQVYHLDDSDSNLLWEWIINIHQFQNISIKINKAPENYEDMFIYLPTSSGTRVMTTKDITNCENGSFDLEVKNVDFMIVRIKKLSALSHYSFTISIIQEEQSSVVKVIVLIIVLWLMVAFTTFTLVASYYSIREWWKKRQQRIFHAQALLDHVRSQKTRITDTLQTMRNGELKEFDIKFHSENWVVCLDSFDKNSLVCITNECNHIFHSSWLEEWYKNIDPKNSLWWPHWKTINVPGSERRNKINIFGGVQEIEEEMRIPIRAREEGDLVLEPIEDMSPEEVFQNSSRIGILNE